MYPDDIEVRQTLMGMIVSECEVKPTAYVDDGSWTPFDDGFEDFDTTDGRSFPWVEHVYKVIDNKSSVAVFAIESEDKMPSRRLQELWSSLDKKVLLQMGCYHVTRVEFDDCHGVWWTLIVATVNEGFDTYLFVINN